MLNAIGTLRLLGFAIVLSCCGVHPVTAQVYPTKPVRLVVPWPPGGGTDILARAMADKLTETWNQTVYVDNRAGAGGNIGTEIAAKSAADGYTIIFATSSLAYNPALYKALSYDAIKDFVPITLVASIPHVLVVNGGSSISSVRDLITQATANPGKLNYASAGNGSNFHLAAELFTRVAKIKAVHIPYKGGGPAVTAVIAGEVDFTFANLVAALPHVQSGRLRALGVTSEKRSRALPDVPTISESGLTGYEFSTWFGVLAPTGTPPEIIRTLNRDIVRILKTQELMQRLTREGAELIASTPEEFAAFLKQDTDKWSVIIRDADIRAE
jgi:tripartite-type tricarboxylate transporter receptor subunit TctC